MTNLVAPVAGLHKRARANLALALPELADAEARRICRAVTDNLGRTTAETYSHAEFDARYRDLPLSGRGWEALEAARRAARPIILFTGHFGNAAAARVALRARGYNIGVLYRPFSNPFFEARHRVAQDAFGLGFPRGPEGMKQMIRHLRQGHCLAVFGDKHVLEGAPLRFFGQPAATSTSPARMALKYGAILVPIYGVRRPDGIGFDVVIEPPVPTGDPEAMTQRLNDSLEAMVRKNPEQWMWTHRRWKVLDEPEGLEQLQSQESPAQTA